MSIPSKLHDEIASLQAQVAAASPLTSAGRATVTAIKLNAGNLVADADTALAVAAGSLDTWEAPALHEPVTIIAAVLGLLVSAQDQSDIALARGLVGRVASNISQLP